MKMKYLWAHRLSADPKHLNALHNIFKLDKAFHHISKGTSAMGEPGRGIRIGSKAVTCPKGFNSNKQQNAGLDAWKFWLY